jgi:hypothetical protein
MADPSACFVCGGDIPKSAVPILIANTTLQPARRRPGQACRCEVPELLHMEENQLPGVPST